MNYALRRIGANPSTPPLYTGEARSIAAFNATASQYATLVSEREVQARAAQDVADKIAKRLRGSLRAIVAGVMPRMRLSAS